VIRGGKWEDDLEHMGGKSEDDLGHMGGKWEDDLGHMPTLEAQQHTLQYFKNMISSKNLNQNMPKNSLFF